MNDSETRPETIVAALLLLITAYQRSRCPVLAACIARHFQHLRGHPATDRVLRDVAGASIAEWKRAAQGVRESITLKTPSFNFLLH